MLSTLLLLLLTVGAQFLSGRGTRCGCNYRLQTLAPSQVLTTCVHVRWLQISATGSGSECLPQQPVIKAPSHLQALKEQCSCQQLQVLALSDFHEKLLYGVFDKFWIKT